MENLAAFSSVQIGFYDSVRYGMKFWQVVGSSFPLLSRMINCVCVCVGGTQQKCLLHLVQNLFRSRISFIRTVRQPMLCRRMSSLFNFIQNPGLPLVSSALWWKTYIFLSPLSSQQYKEEQTKQFWNLGFLNLLLF